MAAVWASVGAMMEMLALPSPDIRAAGIRCSLPSTSTDRLLCGSFLANAAITSSGISSSTCLALSPAEIWKFEELEVLMASTAVLAGTVTTALSPSRTTLTSSCPSGLGFCGAGAGDPEPLPPEPLDPPEPPEPPEPPPVPAPLEVCALSTLEAADTFSI
ncbi:hypothetical protein D3C77_475950 [compost metagenome]